MSIVTSIFFRIFQKRSILNFQRFWHSKRLQLSAAGLFKRLTVGSFFNLHIRYSNGKNLRESADLPPAFVHSSYNWRWLPVHLIFLCDQHMKNHSLPAFSGMPRSGRSLIPGLHAPKRLCRSCNKCADTCPFHPNKRLHHVVRSKVLRTRK